MRASRLTASGDWTFGRGRANYLIRSESVLQSLMTRIRSFNDDWFLDVDAGIDWISLLGSRNSEQQIQNNVERITLETEGIARIDLLELNVNRVERHAIIRLQVTTIFDEAFELGLPVGDLPTPPPSVTGSLALESGGYFLLETGGQLKL